MKCREYKSSRVEKAIGELRNIYLHLNLGEQYLALSLTRRFLEVLFLLQVVKYARYSYIFEN